MISKTAISSSVTLPDTYKRMTDPQLLRSERTSPFGKTQKKAKHPTYSQYPSITNHGSGVVADRATKTVVQEKKEFSSKKQVQKSPHVGQPGSPLPKPLAVRVHHGGCSGNRIRWNLNPVDIDFAIGSSQSKV